MLSLNNQIIFITGASSGIGKACAEQYAALGASLILTARRVDRIEALAEELTKKHGVKCLAIQMDVTEQDQVIELIANLPPEWQAINILINNAGLALSSDPIQSGKFTDWNTMIDTNIRGLLYVTHAILPGMIERDHGHIVNIGSIAGRDPYPGGNVYCATKHAVKSLTQALRIDLLGTSIRVTEVAPGATETEFSKVRWNDQERSDQFYSQFKALTADDVADSIVYATTRPAHVNISELVLYPTCQATTNHIHKKASS